MRSRTSWWNRRPVVFAGWAGALCLTAAARAGVLPPPVENLAPTGTAFQSTTDFGGVASRGNDDNTDPLYGDGSVTHTDVVSSGNYWQVNLPAKSEVSRIEVYNRGDCCGARLSNFRVSVLNNGTETFGQDYFVGDGSVPQSGSESIALPAGTRGDAVRVQLRGNNNEGNAVLSLAEVKAFGTAGPLRNVALNGTASQSTTDFGGDAGRGIDGISDGNYGNASVTHTDVPSSDNFWQVDLDGDYYLYDVNLYNRSDFDDGRLSNFRLSILRDGEEVYGANYFEGSGGVARGGVLNVPLPAVFGDAVKVQILGLNNVGNGILSLAEVQAFGSETPVPEPGAATLAGLALAAVAIRGRSRS